MFATRLPAPALRGLVQGYLFARDLPGVHAGLPIRTFAGASSVLTVHFGRPNASADGAPVPRASLLGPQTRVRGWLSGPETDFVMAMLSPPGLARLFPEAGADALDALLDLGGLIGDGAAARLGDWLPAPAGPDGVAAALDGWLLRRLGRSRGRHRERFEAACRHLLRDGRVDAAAEAAGVTARQLQRWSRALTGLTPKQLFDLERLRASVGAVQTGRGDPAEGHSDQAHQIRAWRRRVGTTPGRYAGARPSSLAEAFHGAGSLTGPAPAFYL